MLEYQQVTKGVRGYKPTGKATGVRPSKNFFGDFSGFGERNRLTINTLIFEKLQYVIIGSTYFATVIADAITKNGRIYHKVTLWYTMFYRNLW